MRCAGFLSKNFTLCFASINSHISINSLHVENNECFGVC